jgi:thyrotropin-releasing hormone receptor
MIESILTFLSNYSKIHGWLSTATCLIGILLNILNILILMRKKFKSNPNSIFMSIAFFNSITMIVYLPYTIHYYIINQNLLSIDADPKRDTLFWTSYAILGTMICLTTHSISIWLTVYLSIYRYITIKKQSLNSHSLKYNNLIILLIIIFCIIISIPSYLYPDILEQNSTSNDSFVYLIRQSDLNIQTNNLIFKLSFYTQAIPAKIIPCCLLSIFIPLIIYNLIIINKKKERLLNLNNRRNSCLLLQQKNGSKSSNRKNKNEHIQKTVMLLLVCLLLLIAELPQAILLLCSIFSDYIYWSFYKPLGDLLDIIVFITYPIDFFIYCSMSKLFRKEFYVTFNFKKIT